MRACTCSFFINFFCFLIVIFLLVNVEKWTTWNYSIFSGVCAKFRQISHYFYPQWLCLTVCKSRWITIFCQWKTYKFFSNWWDKKKKLLEFFVFLFKAICLFAKLKNFILSKFFYPEKKQNDECQLLRKKII